MTPIEELDLARAKILFDTALAEETEEFRSVLWAKIVERKDDVDTDYPFIYVSLSSIRAIRLSDEARGLRVVPVELTKEMLDMAYHTDTEARDQWSDFLAASPYTPGDGT